MRPQLPDAVTDPLLDLLLGAYCVGCARPGRLWCRACEHDLDPTPYVARPRPCPPGLVTPWAAAPYRDPVRSLVVGHKERAQWSLARPLSLLLARAVAAAVPGDDPVLLVPAPSRPGIDRRRGHAPTRTVVDGAAALLRRTGRRVHAAALLVVRPGVADQAGLDQAQRAANLAGSMWVPDRRLRRLARTGRTGAVVVCDDVLTTGATAREAQRALAAVGLPPAAVAVVAATIRRDAEGGPDPSLSGSPSRG